MNTDPGSLQNLNDIVLPAAVPWWPLAPGWYALLALSILLIAFYTYRAIRLYRANRYRRAALKQLRYLQTQAPSVAATAIPVLLKQTALAVFPRKKVAALSGSEWSDFLDRTSAGHAFSGSSGRLLERLSYTDIGVGDTETQGLFRDAEAWIRKHKVEYHD